MLGVNLRTYLLAGEAVGEPAALYQVAPAGHPALTWVYPPVVVLPFVGLAAVVPPIPAYPVWAGGLVLAGAATGGVVLRVVEGRTGRLPRIDRALVVAGTALSPHAAPSLFYGNVNPLLALAVAGALLAAERGRERATGVALALPAVVKLFPAAFGLWLLGRRAWRAAAAAVATGLAGLLVGLVLLGPSPHRAFVTTALLPRRRTGLFAGGLDPAASYVTLRRPLSWLLPDAPGLVGPLAVLLLAPAVGVVLARAPRGTTTGRVLALHAVVVGVLLCLPSYAVYVVFAVPTLVALLYLLPAGPGRRLVLVGAGLATVTVTLGSVREVAPGPVVAALAPVLRVATPQLLGLVVTLFGAVVAAGRLGRATRRSG